LSLGRCGRWGGRLLNTSKSYVKNLPIDVLKELCVEFGLPHEGMKKDVVERLWAVAMPAHRVMTNSARQAKNNYPGNFPMGLRKGERGVEMEGGFDKYAQVDYSPDAHELRPAPPASAAATRQIVGPEQSDDVKGLFSSSLFPRSTGSSLFPPMTEGSSLFPATTTEGSSLFRATTAEGSSLNTATTEGSSLFPAATGSMGFTSSLFGDANGSGAPLSGNNTEGLTRRERIHAMVRTPHADRSRTQPPRAPLSNVCVNMRSGRV
jgi:hypothetical protein